MAIAIFFLKGPCQSTTYLTRGKKKKIRKKKGGKGERRGKGGEQETKRNDRIL